MTSPADLTLTEVAARIRAGTLTSEETTRACLERIEKVGPPINAFVAVEAERAIAQSRAADASLRAGHLVGPLHGVPLAHKDMFYRAGEESACGSLIRRGWKAPVTADTLVRLDRAGAVTLGRLGMSEFAIGPIGLNVHYGPVRNPWNTAHVSGGSSSGPAAAVASRLAFGAMGSDTGASIRVPAAACGVVGLKPSVGLIERAGTMPLSSTLDVVGPIARTVRDVALLTAVLAAPADIDLTTAVHPAFRIAAAGNGAPPPGLRVGIPCNFFVDDLDPQIVDLFKGACHILRDLRLSVVEVDASAFAAAGQLYGTIFGAEASALHARLLDERSQDYSPQVRARLQSGRAVSAEAYVAALAERARLLPRVLAEVFGLVDVVVAPVLSRPVPTLSAVDVGAGPQMTEVIGWFLRLTSPVNVLGLPALSVPAGFTSDGLPFGIQLISTPWADPLLLELGSAFERAAGLSAAPPLFPRRIPLSPGALA